MQRSDFEIMAPVGSYESLRAAIEAGADAVYFGVGELNMRARSAANFTVADLERIVAIAKQAGIKSYLTVNTILYDGELDAAHRLIDEARRAGIDAIIAADLAAIFYARRTGVEVHISTQCNVSNGEAVKFYAQWADVMVLARELDLEQVGRIARQIEQQQICGPSGRLVRIEMFAHGALCMAISGRCYLSLHENGCSANRGACLQLCRRKYTLTDTQSGQVLDTDGRYILSPKDLCTIDLLPQMARAGVRVLKIEGRARGAEYVHRVVGSYDRVLRAMEAGTYTPELVEREKERLAEVFNRGFWNGYYTGATMAEHSTRYGSDATKRKVYVGKVTNYYRKLSVAEVLVEAAPLHVGEEIFFLGPTTGLAAQQLDSLRGPDGNPAQTAKQGEVCAVHTGRLVRRGDSLYKMVPSDGDRHTAGPDHSRD